MASSMIVLSLVSAGAAAAGNVMSSEILKSSAESEAAAQKEALARKEQILAESTEKRKDLVKTGTQEQIDAISPYDMAGKEALDLYMERVNNPQKMEETPEYQFRKEQTLKGISQQAAAAGKGRSDIALQQYYAPALQSLSANEVDRFQTSQNNYLANLNPIINKGFSTSQNMSNIYGDSSGRLEDIEAYSASNRMASEVSRGDIEAERMRKKAKANADIYSGLGNIGQQAALDYANFAGKKSTA
jgi:hypothetical protein